MTWWEWLLWRYERRRAARQCHKKGHIIRGPEMCMDGKYRYHCINCPYRFLTERVILGVIESHP